MGEPNERAIVGELRARGVIADHIPLQGGASIIMVEDTLRFALKGDSLDGLNELIDGNDGVFVQVDGSETLAVIRLNHFAALILGGTPVKTA
jgi:hypothetical protein